MCVHFSCFNTFIIKKAFTVSLEGQNVCKSHLFHQKCYYLELFLSIWQCVVSVVALYFFWPIGWTLALRQDHYLTTFHCWLNSCINIHKFLLISASFCLLVSVVPNQHTCENSLIFLIRMVWDCLQRCIGYVRAVLRLTAQPFE